MEKAPVLVGMRLPEDLFHLLSEHSPSAAVRLQESVERTLAAFGIGASASIELSGGPWLVNPGGCLIDIEVNHTACRYPTGLLRQVWDSSLNLPLRPKTDEGISGEVEELPGAAERSAKWLEFLGSATSEILKLNPAVFFDSIVAHAYRANLVPLIDDGERLLPEGEKLRKIVLAPLESRIPIGEWLVVAEVLARHREKTVTALQEELIERLQAPRIGIELSSETMRWLTIDHHDQGDCLRRVRGNVVRETGVPLPEFCFSASSELPPGAFAFRINHLCTPVMVLPARHSAVVDRPPDELADEGVPARGVARAVSLRAASIVESGDLPPGAFALTPFEYMAEWFEDALRNNLAALVTNSSVGIAIDALYSSHPNLREESERLPSAELTAVLRHLVAGRFPIRNLPRILDRLLESAAPDLSKSTAAAAAAYVRAGLTHEIRAKFGSGTLRQTVVVYLLDRKLEEIAELENDGARLFCDAIGRELSYLPKDVSAPHILTTQRYRDNVWKLVRPVYPRLGVLALEELPSDVNVQPIARISISE